MEMESSVIGHDRVEFSSSFVFPSFPFFPFLIFFSSESVEIYLLISTYQKWALMDG